MNIITHILEFNRLYLVWQTHRDPKRLRYTIASLDREGENIVFRYLRGTPGFESALQFGFSGYPAFDIALEQHSVGIVDAFMRRLPPRSRGDFNQFLEMLRLPINAPINDFSLLAYSGAKVAGDDFSIVPDFQNQNGPFEFMTEIAGYRHFSELPISELELDTEVSFESEPTNEVDKNAIRVLSNGKMLGYVIRTILPQFNQWIKDRRIISATVERKNGQPDRPVVYLFIKIKEGA